MASKYKFPNVFPIDGVTFFNGEQPSPAKFTGIFKYINTAFASMESFLGNGLDYGKPGVGEDRLTILNISNSIGHMDKLYASINILPPLRELTFSFSVTDKPYQDQEVINDDRAVFIDPYLLVYKDFYVPVGKTFSNDLLLCLNFLVTSGTNLPSVTVHYYDKTTDAEEVVSLDMESSSLGYSGTDDEEYVLKYTSEVIPKDNFIIGIKFDKQTVVGQFRIYSAALVELTQEVKVADNFVSSKVTTLSPTGNKIPLNIMHSIGDEATSLTGGGSQGYKVAERCAYYTVCNKSTGSSCIGNTFDFYVREANPTVVNNRVGRVLCAGDTNAVTSADASIIPDHEYAPESSITTPVDGYIRTAIQSPLYGGNKNGALRLHPINISTEILGTTIDNNLIALYDRYSATSPIVPVLLHSSGSPFNVFAQHRVNEIETSSDRYIIVGGSFGIADMLAMLSRKTDNRNIAVYAE